MRSMEGVLKGRELACWRAARRADLVPEVGSAVGQVMAGSWTQATKWAAPATSLGWAGFAQHRRTGIDGSVYAMGICARVTVQ